MWQRVTMPSKSAIVQNNEHAMDRALYVPWLHDWLFLSLNAWVFVL